MPLPALPASSTQSDVPGIGSTLYTNGDTQRRGRKDCTQVARQRGKRGARSADLGGKGCCWRDVRIRLACRCAYRRLRSDYWGTVHATAWTAQARKEENGSRGHKGTGSASRLFFSFFLCFWGNVCEARGGMRVHAGTKLVHRQRHACMHACMHAWLAGVGVEYAGGRNRGQVLVFDANETKDAPGRSHETTLSGE